MKTKFYRISENYTDFIKNVHSPKILAEGFFKFFENQPKDKEQFCVAELSCNYNVKSIGTVAIGTVNRCNVYLREVFRNAVKNNTSAIAICHNHPSGNLEPSSEDIFLTENLMKSSELLGIKLLDHIIVSSDKEYYSFLEHSLLN